MVRGVLLLSLILTGSWLTPVSAEPSRDDFFRAYPKQLRRVHRVSEPVAVAAEFDYLLIGGIVSDYIQYLGYFKTFSAELTKQGVPASQIHTFFPLSRRGVEENAADLHPAKWADVLAKSERKLVVVAHSKGAVETIEFLLKHPELHDRLEAVVCLQGAFGGSELADFLMKEYDEPGRPDRWWPRTGMSLFRVFDRLFHGKVAGIESLTTAKARERITRWYQDHAEALKSLRSKLLFVTTFAAPAQMDFRLRVGGAYLKSVGVLENDGALGVSSQYLPTMGERTISIEGIDHGLPCGNLIARRHFDRARAFVRALVRSIGKPAP